MNIFQRSGEFDAWLANLKDKVARARITLRIRSAEHGNFGDCEPVGEGVSEMRVHVGPGYRAYFTRRVAPGWFICFWWVAINPLKSVTSNVPLRWRAL